MAVAADFGARDRYRDLMIDAKARLASIDRLVLDQRGIPSPLVREYAVLQIRMLCEIIGLACLVAHGDLVAQGPANLRKAYAPGEIFAALDEMHDDFYPVPMLPQQAAPGWHMAEYDGPPFLEKGEVKVLWDRCGGDLHKGSLKRLLKANNPVQNNFADISDWSGKVMNLLANHRVLRRDRKLVFIAILSNAAGAVQVEIGVAVEPEGGGNDAAV
jgi:hypothetical protein